MGTLRIKGVTSGYIDVQANAESANYTLRLPAANSGIDDQFLQSDANGNLSFSYVTSAPEGLNVTGNLSVSQNVTVSGDLGVVGNLSVGGLVTYISSNQVSVGDAILALNADLDSGTAPSENAGIEVNRGSSDNVSIIWNETNDKWTFTNDGTNYYNIGSDASETYGNAAFAAANTADDKAETSGDYANSAFDAANTADGKAVTSGDYANSAFDAANTADGKAVTSGDYANSAFDAANTTDDKAETSGDYANSAFAVANNSLNTATGGTVTGDVTITGNFTVVGETVYANTTTVTIADNIITLNAAVDQASAPISNAGLEVDRGLSDNVAIIWNETDDKWTFTNDGTSYSNVGSAAAESYANSAFGTANAAVGTAASALTAAGVADGKAVTSGDYANSAFGVANTATDNSSAASSYANSAFDVANTATTDAATADGKAVTSGDYANSAFGVANTIYGSSGGVSYILSPSITLNASSGQAEAPSVDVLISVDRGSSDNVAIKWNETTDSWQITNNGSTYSNVQVTVASTQTLTPGAQPDPAAEGMLAIADGVNWNPAGDGTKQLMVYLSSSWRRVSLV